jgi:pimeloyl-ACP methyl ester carboxylesterase
MLKSRRDFLSLGAGGAAALGLVSGRLVHAGNTQTAAKSPIVLIHGAWQGGWGWKETVPLLWQAGHATTSPTLSGMGERRNVPPQACGLQVHIDDIVAHLEMQDLRNVVLVGHSYGGCVLSGVLARQTGRVAHAIYVDAYVPGSGEGILKLLTAEERGPIEALAAAGGAIPVPPENTWGERWGLISPELRAWARPRMSPQPALTFTETVNGDPFAQPLKLTYIKCRNNPNPGFWAMTKRIKADPRFSYREIAGPHMVMLTNPKGFTQALLAAL